jgi:Ca2+-transporting ATPase
MTKKPNPRSMPLITLNMTKMIFGQVIFQLVILLMLYFRLLSFPRYRELLNSDAMEAKTRRNTIVFNTFVWLQIFNALSSQSPDNRFRMSVGIMRSRLFLLVGFLIAGGQVLIIFMGGKAFKVVPLDARDWGLSFGIGTLSVFCRVVLALVPDPWVGGIYGFIARVFRMLIRRADEERLDGYDSDWDGR